MNVGLVLKLVGRDWKAGELRLLLVALIVAVGTIAAISLTVSRLEVAMLYESASYLAADRVIAGNQAIPDEFQATAETNGLQTTQVMEFNSMLQNVSNRERTIGASVKAVESSYPMRGTLKVATEPFAQGTPTDQLPEAGEVWLESRLFPALDVELGEAVSIGYATFKVTGIIASEPDRGQGFMSMGPRALMRLTDVAETNVIQPGSRISYRLLLAGPVEGINDTWEALKEFFVASENNQQPEFDWISVRDAQRSIARAMNRAERFFLIAGSLAVLLAGVAIALSANRYASRHVDHIGILKTLGATPIQILVGCVILVLIIGVIGIAGGLTAGSVVHFLLLWNFGHLLPPNLPLPGMRPIVLSVVTGLVCLLAFALPPLVRLKNTSPLRVLRKLPTNEKTGVIWTYVLALAGSFGLLVWYARDVELVVALLAGIAISSIAFSVLALVLLRTGRVAGMQAGSYWRLALAGLQRRYKSNTAQIIVFGLTIMLLLIIYLIRTSLIDEWRAQMPDDVPNHFVLNVTNDQSAGVQELINAHATYPIELVPMISGNIVSVNGESARDYRRRLWQEGRRRGPGSNRQITFLHELPDGNRIIEGQWWDSDTDEALISIEKEFADSWHLGLGDVIETEVFGTTVSATISNVRSLEWDTPQINFFLIYSPPVLREFPANFMGPFQLDFENRRYVSNLIHQYPTITVIDVGEIINQIRTIINRATQAVEWVLYLVLASGALVLIAAIQAARDQRMKEHALIRSLGGARKLITGSLIVEFAILGLMAGIVAVCGAELSMWFIERVIFDFDYAPRAFLWILGPAIGGALVLIVGYLGTRRLIHVEPMRILRES